MLLFIAGLFYACNDFPEVPDTDEGEGTVYEYCFFDDGGYCLTGPFSSCPRGGQLSNSCEARVVEGMSYCVFDADSLCVIGGGDISECPENSRSQTFCPYPIPSDTTGKVLPDSVRHYCEFEDGEGNKICLPSPYANGFCGKNATKAETCYFADPTATTKTGLCNDEFYDKSTHFCGFDSVKKEYIIRDLCGGKSYDVSSLFCNQENILGYCGAQLYNYDLSFCNAGVLFDKCGGEEYDIENKFCVQAKYHAGLQGKDTLLNKSESLSLICNGDGYKTEDYFCPEGSQAYALCNEKAYDIETQYCQGGIIGTTPTCGGEEYNPYNPSVFDPENPGQICNYKNGEPIIETLCGHIVEGSGIWYDDKTEFCDYSDYYDDYGIAPKCNGEEYNYLAKEKKFIKNELEFSIWEQESCNNINEIIYVCDIYGHGELSDYRAKNIETGESQYEVEINSEFCFNATDSFTFNEGNKASGLYVVPLCGGSGGAPYDVTRQFCNEGEIEPIE